MKLKKGITGFWHLTNDIPAPSIAISTIKSLLAQLEADSNYVVTAITDVEINNNYFTIGIVDRAKNLKFNILVNAQYPYYCGTTSESSWMNLSFIDLDYGIRFFFDKELEYVSPTQLNKEYATNDLKDLSQTEIEQIDYWGSKSFGEIMFNGYD